MSKPGTISKEPNCSEDSSPNPRQNIGQITPFESIHDRRLRLTADSPDLLAIIKQEGRV
jgi:hypothetical protein